MPERSGRLDAYSIYVEDQMEPGIMIAIFISCGVAIGAALFVVFQGAKQQSKDDGDKGDG